MSGGGSGRRGGEAGGGFRGGGSPDSASPRREAWSARTADPRPLSTWRPRNAAALLRTPGPHDDKYRMGVLGVRTGSNAYPGAAVLGVEAAWRTGAGMVRYEPPLDDGSPAFGLPGPAAAVLAARPETVFGAARDSHTDAWLIGSGSDPAARSAEETALLRELLAGAAPVVVDAGALGLGAGVRAGESVGVLAGSDAAARAGADAVSGAAMGAGMVRAPRILTPHAGEFAALWTAAGLGPLPTDAGQRRSPRLTEDEDARADAAARLAAATGATVLLKGSVTVSATPGGFVARVGPATPRLATAGTGDVLAGILGALVAAHAAQVRADPELLGPLGATASLVHDAAARRAAGPESRPVTALDVARAVPAAAASLLAGTARA